MREKIVHELEIYDTSKKQTGGNPAKKTGQNSPEERMDAAILSENWRMFLVVILFLEAGIGGFAGLMPKTAAVSVAGIFASLEAALTAAPLFWETDAQGRLRRRICRASYFPIRKKAFVLSKWKRMLAVGSICFLVFLVVQLIAAPLFGMENILLFQAAFSATFVINMLFYTALGMLGA